MGKEFICADNKILSDERPNTACTQLAILDVGKEME
jgi:hypothetical protein